MARKRNDSRASDGGLGGGADAGMRAGRLIREARPLILSHRGALGDFLVSWPAIRALALARPDDPPLWAGRPEYLFFLEPLGIRRADPALLKAVDRLYGGDAAALPPWAALVRFALKPGAVFPEHPRVVSIYSIGEDGFDPPGKRQAEALARWGIEAGTQAEAGKEPEELFNKIEAHASSSELPATWNGGVPSGSGPDVPANPRLEFPDDSKEWFPGSLEAFREAFGGVDAGPQGAKALGSPPASLDASPASDSSPDSSPGMDRRLPPALLFPGAGHPAKAWPLVQYLELAQRLPELGLAPVFVLGPAEIERGMDAGGYPRVHPGSLAALTGLLNRAALVVGNDSGPLHLSGMLGRPSVGLFGPSSRRQWGPPGVAALARDLPCRPCTRTTAGLDCPEPVCLAELDVETVLAAVRRVLARPETATP